MFFCRNDDEFAGGYEALLVGEAYGFSGADCSVRGFEASYAYDRGDDEVHLGKGGDVDTARGAVDYFDVGDARLSETALEGVGEFFSGERDDSRAPAEALGEGCFEVMAGGEGDDLVAVGEGFAYGKGAVADGAGRAENC